MALIMLGLQRVVVLHISLTLLLLLLPRVCLGVLLNMLLVLLDLHLVHLCQGLKRQFDICDEGIASLL